MARKLQSVEKPELSLEELTREEVFVLPERAALTGFGCGCGSLIDADVSITVTVNVGGGGNCNS